MHFCGADADRFWAFGMAYYCKRATKCNPDLASPDMKDIDKSWGLVYYYINMPWQWAFYMGESMAAGGGKGGVPLIFNEEVVTEIHGI